MRLGWPPMVLVPIVRDEAQDSHHDPAASWPLIDSAEARENFLYIFKRPCGRALWKACAPALGYRPSWRERGLRCSSEALRPWRGCLGLTLASLRPGHVCRVDGGGARLYRAGHFSRTGGASCQSSAKVAFAELRLNSDAGQRGAAENLRLAC
jgi:hypothetical protein